MTAVTIGIDPGLDGALALLLDGHLFNVVDMPTVKVKVNGKRRREVVIDDVIEIIDDFAGHRAPFTNITCAIERVWSSPQQGVISAFSMGYGYAVVKTAAVGEDCNVVNVLPATWKGHFGLSSDKGESLDLARTIWPDRADLCVGPKGGHRDGRTEAALIGLYVHQMAKAAA